MDESKVHTATMGQPPLPWKRVLTLLDVFLFPPGAAVKWSKHLAFFYFSKKRFNVNMKTDLWSDASWIEIGCKSGGCVNILHAGDVFVSPSLLSIWTWSFYSIHLWKLVQICWVHRAGFTVGRRLRFWRKKKPLWFWSAGYLLSLLP